MFSCKVSGVEVRHLSSSEAIIIFLLAVLEFELGFILARQTLYHMSHASIRLCSGYFADRLPRPAWTSVFLFVFSIIAGVTGVHNHIQLFSIEVGVSKSVFTWAGLELRSSQSQPCK
jgi:hypothetical protein